MRALPLDPNLKTLDKVAAADLDQDGWFELCGWHDRALYAIDPVDKTLIWRALENSPDNSDLFAGPGRIYVSTRGALLALDGATGAQLWSAELSDVRAVHDSGAAPHAVIWVEVAGEQLFTLDRDSGATHKSSPMNDGVSLFRTLVGPNLVWHDASTLRVLHAGQAGPGFVLGGSIQPAAAEMMANLAAGNVRANLAVAIPAQVEAAIVHRGVIYVVVKRHGERPTIEAYRAVDQTLVARRAGVQPAILVGAVAGQPIAMTDPRGHVLQRSIDNVAWTAPGFEPEIVETRGVGAVLVVVFKRRDTGSNRYDIVGLAAATLAPVWHIENIGYVYGAVAFADDAIVVPIGIEGSVSLVGIAASTGARLWETVVANEQGLGEGGGLVYQKHGGTTLLAATGQMIFPTDRRTSTPAPPSTAPPAEELPDWGIEAIAPIAKPKKSPIGAIILTAVLLALAAGIAGAIYNALKMH